MDKDSESRAQKKKNSFIFLLPRRILSYPKIPKLAQIRIQSGGIMQVRGVERRGRRHPPPVPEARQPLSKTKPDGSGACPPSGRGVEPSGSFDFAERAACPGICQGSRPWKIGATTPPSPCHLLPLLYKCPAAGRSGMPWWTIRAVPAGRTRARRGCPPGGGALRRPPP